MQGGASAADLNANNEIMESSHLANQSHMQMLNASDGPVYHH